MRKYIAYLYEDFDDDHIDEWEYAANDSREAERLAYEHFSDDEMVEIVEVID